MKKMLIVEDDILSQNFLRRLFNKNYEIDFAISAEEFYSNYSTIKYDIIIMDVSLKGTKNGFELTKEMKAMPHLSNTPVLCLTAHAFLRDRAMADSVGVDYYLAKPVSNELLKEVVEKLVNKNF